MLFLCGENRFLCGQYDFVYGQDHFLCSHDPLKILDRIIINTTDKRTHLSVLYLKKAGYNTL